MTNTPYNLNGTSGTAATTGNTGAFQLFTGTNSTQTLSSAAAFQGTTGLRTVSDGTAASGAVFKFGGAATATQAAFSFRFKIPSALPSINSPVFMVLDTGLASPGVMQIQYTTAGVLQIIDKNNSTAQILSAAQATAGLSIRLSVIITTLSATVGALTVKAYTTGSTQVGSTVSSSAANLGTTAMAGVAIGQIQSIAGTYDYDDVQLNDGSTTDQGEYVPSSTPPTVVAGANQTIASTGTVTTLTCTATPQGGATISSYQWALVSAISSTGAAITPPTITNATSQSATFTPATKGRYIFSVTATDSNGNTSTAVTTRVFVPDSLITPIEITSNAGWTTATAANLNDGLDTTYGDSGAAGSGNVLVIRLAPLIVATSGFSMTVRSLVQAVGGTQRVELLEGATVRKNWGALAPSTTMGNQALTLTGTEMGTVTSWNELDVRLTQV